MATSPDLQRPLPIEPVDVLRARFGELDGLALLRALLPERPLGPTALVSSFGTESAALLDLVATIDPTTPVIFLDTGQLFPETHSHRELLTQRLGLLDVRVVQPDRDSLADDDPRGILWRLDPDRCCALRKVAPLERALVGFDAWITGRKQFQGGSRGELPTIESDPQTGRIKLNPLARWSEEDLDRYLKLRDLPQHPLAAAGYRSLGCSPCTRPVTPGESQRAGRWAGLDKTECGIHGDGI